MSNVEEPNIVDSTVSIAQVRGQAFELAVTLLTKWAESTEVPLLTAKILRFLNNNREEILALILSEKQSPEVWIAEVASGAAGRIPGGTEILESQGLPALRDISAVIGGLPGSVYEWFRLLVRAIDEVCPAELPEWEELSGVILRTEMPHDGLWAMITEMESSLQPSVDAGLVAINIRKVAEQDLAKGLSLCLHWMSRFAALTELAFPSSVDVQTFAAVCDLKKPTPDSVEELNLGVLLQHHPSFAGMFQALIGSMHPFALLLQQGSKRNLKDFTYLVEINDRGDFKRLRNVVPSQTGVCVKSSTVLITNKRSRVSERELLTPDDVAKRLKDVGIIITGKTLKNRRKREWGPPDGIEGNAELFDWERIQSIVEAQFDVKF